MKPVYISLEAAIDAGEVRNGDVLLWRPANWFSRAIARLCGGQHSHAGLVAWWAIGYGATPQTRNYPMVLETREWVGGRATTLWSQVLRAPERIDVFRAPRGSLPTVGLDIAADQVRLQTGREYGWRNVMLASLYRLPLWRMLVTAPSDDEHDPKRPPFCSELIAKAYRKAGLDLTRQTPDRLTTPADLAKSQLEHQYTIGGLK